MSSSPLHNQGSPAPVPPSPPLQSNPGAGGVRRYHTISAHSRSARSTARPISEETSDHPVAPEDEYINPGEEWVAPGVGAVGEKNTSLHRQASLPTKYHTHRGYQSQSHPSGSSTPLRTMNSLSAIQAEHGLDGDGEEDWEAEMRGLRNSESETLASSQQMSSHQHGSGSPISPSFAAGEGPSSPPATSGASVRRHQSLTYGASHNQGANIRRSGTLAGVKAPRRNNTIGLDTPSTTAAVPGSPSPPDNEEHYVEEESEQQEQVAPMSSIQQPQPQGYATSSPGGRSPWSTPGPPEWRGINTFPQPSAAYAAGNSPTNVLDDVQRAFSALELNSGTSNHGGQQMMQMNNMQGLNQPPRFSNQNNIGPRASNMAGARSSDMRFVADLNAQMGTSLFDNSQVNQNAGAISGMQGPFNASGSYAGSIGHGSSGINPMQGNADDLAAAAQQQGGIWDARERGIPRRPSNSNLQPQQNWTNTAPPVPPIPQQYLQQQTQQQQAQQHQQAPRLAGINYNAALSQPLGSNAGQMANAQGNQYHNSPIDVPTLIATKGYNPTNFDIRPSFARYFVIKSYTEDDVHKSLKYEIWSSTDPGNKRLDKAFKEVNGRGPIYLFFSVNASGHFCGMAEMLTPVDYTRSSTVWASDKWKGVFKVRWIFVRDIPNANLRHIRLNNTQERKPVTNSRDTQELLPEAGHEMLRIFFTHPARTSLLQDFAYYEMQSMQKAVSAAPQPSPSPTQHNQGSQSPQQGLSPATQNAAIYSVSQPMANPVSMMQGQHLQSVMRNPSPAPAGSYVGMGNVAGNYPVQQ